MFLDNVYCICTYVFLESFKTLVKRNKFKITPNISKYVTCCFLRFLFKTIKDGSIWKKKEIDQFDCEKISSSSI